MESSSLAAAHSLETGCYQEVQISFPFPGIFEFAREAAQKQITDNLGTL